MSGSSQNRHALKRSKNKHEDKKRSTGGSSSSSSSSSSFSSSLHKDDEENEINEDDSNEDDGMNDNGFHSRASKSELGQSRATLKRKKQKEKKLLRSGGGPSSFSYGGSGTNKSDDFEDDFNSNTKNNDVNNDDDDDDDGNLVVNKSSSAKKAKVGNASSQKTKNIEINSKFDHCKTILDVLEVSSSSNAANVFVDSSIKSLALLISPTDINSFFSDFWGQTPLVSQVRVKNVNTNGSSNNSNSSRSKDIYKGLFSMKKLESILDTQILLFSNDINIVRYVNSKQESVYNEGNKDIDEENAEPVPTEVSGAEIKRKFSEGYSIEFNTATKYDDNLWHFASLLEHILESSIESIVSWTPRGVDVQARPPHVNMGDAILLQLEGSSRIEIYAPIQGVLSDNDINGEKPLPDSPYMSIELKSGDSVYVPRSWITIRRSTVESNSLSLELKFNINNTYYELLDMVLPQALAAASCAENSSIRDALPRAWPSFMGIAYSELDVEDDRRETFKVQLKRNLMSVVNSVMEHCDAAMDQMAKSYVSRRLPFPMTDDEERRSVIKSKDVVIASYTKLRVMRPNMARAVIEDGMVVVYHCQDNARELYGAPLNPLEFELDDGPAIEILLNAYPTGVTVMDLPHPSDELDDKIGVADALFREGILIIEDEATAGAKEDGSDNGDDDDDDDCPF